MLVALLRAPGAKPALVAQRACAVAAAVAPDAACEPIRALASVALAGGYRMPPRVEPGAASRREGRQGAGRAHRDHARRRAAGVRDRRAARPPGRARRARRGATARSSCSTTRRGDVLAYVGSSGELSRAAEVDGVVAPRQAGSTLKPFLYALALDAKLLTAASLVDDSPLAIATARGMYVPQNYDRDFRGSVSVRTALASSLNVPAVRTLELVGVRRASTRRCAASGFDTLDGNGRLLRRVAGAGRRRRHAARARQRVSRARQRRRRWTARVRVRRDDAGARGRAAPRVRCRRELHRDRHPRRPRRARRDVRARESARHARAGARRRPARRKDMRDNWCVGYTSRYTVGVWVGNFSGAPMHDVSGVTGAAPIWRDVVHWPASRGAPSQRAAPPRRRACAATSRSIRRVEHAAARVVRRAAPRMPRRARERDDATTSDAARAHAAHPLPGAGHGHRARSGHSRARTSASRSSPRPRARRALARRRRGTPGSRRRARCGRPRPAGTRSCSSTPMAPHCRASTSKCAATRRPGSPPARGDRSTPLGGGVRVPRRRTLPAAGRSMMARYLRAPGWPPLVHAELRPHPRPRQRARPRA